MNDPKIRKSEAWRTAVKRIFERLKTPSIQTSSRAVLRGGLLAIQEFAAPVFNSSSFFNTEDNLTLATLSWQLQTYHLALVAIFLGVAILVPLTNPLSKIISSGATPREKAELATQIDKFTPGLHEDPTSLYLALSSPQDGYLKKPLLAETAETPVEVKDKRGSLKYTVETGDTLSSIGWKFGLKLASIKYSNNLENLDSLKPGQALNLPPEDLSPAYIAKIEAQKQAELAKQRQLAAKKKLAQAGGRRSVTVRERADEGFNQKAEGVVVPINYSYVSRGIGGGHTGIDMVADTGTSVRAAKSGRVVEVSRGWSGGYGNEIVIDHGGGVQTRYAHLSAPSVSAGQTVEQGQVIGNSGSTGRSTGPHLHFEYLVGGRSVNPF